MRELLILLLAIVVGLFVAPYVDRAMAEHFGTTPPDAPTPLELIIQWFKRR